MSYRNKKIRVAFAFSMLAIVAVLLTVNILKHGKVDEVFVFAKGSDIQVKDIETYFKHLAFTE